MQYSICNVGGVSTKAARPINSLLTFVQISNRLPGATKSFAFRRTDMWFETGYHLFINNLYWSVRRNSKDKPLRALQIITFHWRKME